MMKRDVARRMDDWQLMGRHICMHIYMQISVVLEGATESSRKSVGSKRRRKFENKTDNSKLRCRPSDWVVWEDTSTSEMIRVLQELKLMDRKKRKETRDEALLLPCYNWVERVSIEKKRGFGGDFQIIPFLSFPLSFPLSFNLLSLFSLPLTELTE